MGDALRRYGSLITVFLLIYGAFVFLQSELRFYEYKASARYGCRQAMLEAVKNKPANPEKQFIRSTRSKGLPVNEPDIVFEINDPCNKQQGCSCSYDIDVELEVPLPGLTDLGVHPGFMRQRHMEEAKVELNLDAY